MKQNTLQSGKRLATLPSAVTSLAILLFMIYSVCTQIVWMRYAVTVIFFLLVFFMTRSKLMTVLAGLACLSTLLSCSYEGGSALLLATIGTIGFGGFAVAFAQPLWWIAPLFLSGTICLLITGEAFVALPILCLALTAMALGIGMHRGFTRTGTAALTAAVGLSSLIGAVLVVVVIQNGGFSANYISDFIVEFRDRFVNETLEVLKSDPDDAMYKALAGYLTAEVLTALVNAVLRLLPALVIIIAELISYFSGLLAVMLCGNWMPKDSLPRASVEFRVTPISAIVYLASFAASLLLGSFGQSDVLGILSLSATTLHLILLPGLGLCGLLFTLAFMRTRMRPGPFTFVLIASILFFSPLYSLYLLAFIGAITLLVSEHRKKKEESL